MPTDLQEWDKEQEEEEDVKLEDCDSKPRKSDRTRKATSRFKEDPPSPAKPSPSAKKRKRAQQPLQQTRAGKRAGACLLFACCTCIHT